MCNTSLKGPEFSLVKSVAALLRHFTLAQCFPILLVVNNYLLGVSYSWKLYIGKLSRHQLSGHEDYVRPVKSSVSTC